MPTWRYREQSLKSFEIETVLSVVVGRTVAEKGTLILELMDHLFPGIFPITAVALMPIAAKHIQEQFPAFDKLPPVTEQNWKEWLVTVKKTLPFQVTLLGPIEVNDGEIKEAMKVMTKKIGEARGL